MNKYRKRPITIEAVQFTGSNSDEIQAAVGAHCSIHYVAGSQEPVLAISTLEGSMTVSKGDWVIKGVKGEFYPCKPDIFAASYDSESEEASV